MNEIVIIDGYNFLFAGGRDPESLDLAHARERLLSQLAQYAALAGVEVLVVFDAYRVKGGRKHSERRDGITVIFTAEGESADTVVERLSSQLAGRFFVSVVTGDLAEQRAVLGYGALRVSPQEFRTRIGEVIRQQQLNVSTGFRPADSYMENYLAKDIRAILAKWRREKKRI